MSKFARYGLALAAATFFVGAAHADEVNIARCFQIVHGNHGKYGISEGWLGGARGLRGGEFTRRHSYDGGCW